MISRIKCWFTGHNWKHQYDADVYENDRARRPCYVKRVFICTKCLTAKRVHL